jgi:hypothetical protein
MITNGLHPKRRSHVPTCRERAGKLQLRSSGIHSLALKTLPRTFGAIDFEQFAALNVSEARWLHGLGRRLSCNLVAYRVPLASRGSRRHLCRVAQTAKLNKSQLRLLAATEVQFDPSIAIVAYRAPWKKRSARRADWPKANPPHALIASKI